MIPPNNKAGLWPF